MKKIAFIVALPILFCLAAFAAEEKETSREAAKSKSSAATSEHKFLAPSEITWSDGPPGLPAGAKMAVLDGDPGKKGSFTVRLQMPDGYKIPPHTHPSAERVTVISGTLHLGMGGKSDEASERELSAGAFAVLPAGMKHFARATGESVIQIQSEGPFAIKYADPADDPRNAKK